MQRVDAMAARLPQLYRDGELIRGSATGATGGVLGVPAVQLEILDEDGREVQIAHWFEAARTLQEAAGLGALLDFSPEPWQTLEIYRAWVDANRDAMVREGAVTKTALERFVEDYSARYQAAVDLTAVRIRKWEDGASPQDAALVETPLKRLNARAPGAGGIEPLFQFSVTQKGLDETFASFLLTGLPSAPESVPVVVNLTTAEALIFLGNVVPGARLAIRAAPDGSVTALLEGVDVTSKLRSVTGILPGTPWPNASVLQPARALRLARGRNDLWFLPVAHFDALGLDRFLLSLADLVLQQGRFDQSSFDHALFYQDPAVVFRISWLETQPARIEVRLPGGMMLSRQGRLAQALQDRDTLETSLIEAVGKLKAAGVASAVTLMPFAEVQGQMDRMAAVLPMTIRETGPSGADSLPDAGGVFEVTAFEDSTFR